MFHHFEGAGHPRVQGALTRDGLVALLDDVGARHRLLPARDWAERAVRGQLADDDVCLTFDDSLRSAFDVARPVLEERGLTGFWFVYTSVVDGALERLELYRQFRNRNFATVDDYNAAFVDRAAQGPHGAMVRQALVGFDPAAYMADYPFYSDGDRRVRFLRDDVLGPARYEEVMDAMIAAAGVDLPELAAGLWLDPDDLVALHESGHVVGLHSHTHPTRLAELPEQQQESEYAQNGARLTEILGSRPTTMSHPSNSYAPSTLRILAAMGVVLGFRTDMAEAASALELPRQDHAMLTARQA
jgi:peptidoglycan/xylan/chitin deacetylase (PgdA/CDA1 family)